MRHLVRLALLLPLAGILAAADAGDEVVALQQRVAELEAQVAELQRTTVPLKPLLDRRDVTIFFHQRPADDQLIALGVKQLLGLDGDEAKQLETIVAETVDAIWQQVAVQKPVAQVTGTTARLTIAEFTEEGKEIELALLRKLEALLGPDRAKFIRQTALWTQESEIFLLFGAGSFDLTLTRFENGSIEVKRAVTSASGNSSGSSRYSKRSAQCRHLGPFLPAGFLDGVTPATGNDF